MLDKKTIETVCPLAMWCLIMLKHQDKIQLPQWMYDKQLELTKNVLELMLSMELEHKGNDVKTMLDTIKLGSLFGFPVFEDPI